MVTASQLLCGNLIHIWQARSCKLVLVAFGHPGDHPERSGPLCIPANSSGAILCLPHRCKRWLRFFVPTLLQLYCTQKVEAQKHEPVASKTLGLHWSFAVHLHWLRICCQVWTPRASHCYPSGHTAFPYNFPHPFPRACENKKAHVWQLLHTEALGVIVESSDGNHLPHGSVPLAWPSVPPSSVTDCELGRKRLTVFKSCILTKPKFWGQRTERKHARFVKKYTDSSSPLVSLHGLQSNCNSTEHGLIHPGENKASFKSSFIYSSQLCRVYRFNQLFP